MPRNVQKKNNNSRNRAKPKRATQKTAPKPKVHIPECTRHYAQALADPFSLNADVCIPDTHSVPSKKAKFILRGAGSTQANKLGYIFANPFYVANDYLQIIDGGDTKEMATISCTDGTGSLTYVDVLHNDTSPNGIEVTPTLRAPYRLADYDSSPTGVPQATTIGAQVRVVGAGLRVRYTGTKLNEGGTILIAKRQDGESFDNFTYDSISAIMNTQVRQFGNKWHQVSYTPVQPDDYDYCRNGAFGSTEGAPVLTAAECKKAARHHLGFVIKSAAASQPFEWEYVVHIEFLGKIIDNISRSHSDIVGLSAVRNALNAASPTEAQSGPGFFTKLMSSIGDEVMQSVPSLIGTGIKLLL
jgi:hypothetical protein